MTKNKFLSLVIVFCVSLSSFGIEIVNSEKIISAQMIESNSSQYVGEIQTNAESENISPPFNFKLEQKVKACHKNKIGPIVAGVVVGVGFLGFIVWAIAADV